MNNSVQVKQADVVLLTYPLDYGQSNYTASDKLLDLDYVSLTARLPYLAANLVKVFKQAIT